MQPKVSHSHSSDAHWWVFEDREFETLGRTQKLRLFASIFALSSGWALFMVWENLFLCYDLSVVRVVRSTVDGGRFWRDSRLGQVDLGQGSVATGWCYVIVNVSLYCWSRLEAIPGLNRSCMCTALSLKLSSHSFKTSDKDGNMGRTSPYFRLCLMSCNKFFFLFWTYISFFVLVEAS